MSIFLNKDSKVIVQGITGGEGTKHTARMLAAGTQVVGGVNARKAGTTVSHVDASGATVERADAVALRRSGALIGLAGAIGALFLAVTLRLLAASRMRFSTSRARSSRLESMLDSKLRARFCVEFPCVKPCLGS